MLIRVPYPDKGMQWLRAVCSRMKAGELRQANKYKEAQVAKVTRVEERFPTQTGDQT